MLLKARGRFPTGATWVRSLQTGGSRCLSIIARLWTCVQILPRTCAYGRRESTPPRVLTAGIVLSYAGNPIVCLFGDASQAGQLERALVPLAGKRADKQRKPASNCSLVCVLSSCIGGSDPVWRGPCRPTARPLAPR
jgi:hypothetical protein